MSTYPPCGMRGIAYHFDETAPIDGITQLRTNPKLLTAFKTEGHARYAKSKFSLTQQAIECARITLARSNLEAAAIDAVIVGSSQLNHWERWPEMVSTEILKGLGLADIPVVGITLAGCANYASSLRMARNMLRAEGLRNVLVIETNQVRGEMKRVLISMTGAPGCIFADGAASFVLTTDEPDFIVDGLAQTVKPIDKKRDSVAQVAAAIGAGFGWTLEQALQQAQVTKADIGAAILTNVNLGAVDSLAEMLGLPSELVFRDNIARIAHVWSADNLINLHDYCEKHQPASGTLFLMLCQADSYYSAIVCRKR